MGRECVLSSQVSTVENDGIRAPAHALTQSCCLNICLFPQHRKAVLLLKNSFVKFSLLFIGCNSMISPLSLLKEEGKIRVSRILSCQGKLVVVSQKVKILHVFILPQTLTWEWAHGIPWEFSCSKAGCTQPAVTSLALQEIAYTNSFLSTEIRITVSQQHYLRFTIPSRYSLHISSLTARIYFGQWFTRSGRRPELHFFWEILTFPNLLWCESEWKQNSLCKTEFREGQSIWPKESWKHSHAVVSHCILCHNSIWICNRI